MAMIPAVSLASECDPHFGGQIDRGTVSYSGVTELSGIAASRRNSDVYYVENDNSGSLGVIAINGNAQYLGLYVLSGFPAGDWEDIDVGPGPVAGVNYIYVGNIGDNAATHAQRYIARIAEPQVSSTQSPVTNTLTGVETITYQYADGPRDAETLMVDPLTKDIYIVSKREAQVRVYRLPYPQSTTTTNIAQYVCTLDLYWTVAGDISPAGNEILIKTTSKTYHWCRTAGQTVGQALSAAPVEVPYVAEPQGEAVCWKADGMGYFTISEGTNPHLYFYQNLTDTQAPGIAITSPAATPATLAQAQIAVVAVATDNVGVTSVRYSLSGSTTGSGSCVPANIQFIAPQSTWKYLTTGSDQGSAWRSVAYNDSAWSSGSGVLGYGNGDEATVISYGGDASNKYMTAYFRKSFTVQNVAALTHALSLRVRRDDGVVVYLNGTEVFRDNLPAGDIGYSTAALVTIDGADEQTYLTASVPANLLVNGTNVVAVEIHQRNAISSDLCFDLSLSHDDVANRWTTGPIGVNAGSTIVTLTASDAAGQSSAASVQVDYDGGPVNLPPSAGDDNAAPINEDATLHAAAPGVLANDSDPEGAILSARIESGAANGTVTLNSDGSYDYYPNANFNGADSFTYRAFDGAKTSAPATVTLTVQAVNDEPQASDLGASVFRGKSVDLVLPASDADGDALTCEILSFPSNGTVEALGGCAVRYTSGTNSGVDSFTYRVSDGQGESLPATVNVSVRHALGGGFWGDADDKSELAVYDRSTGNWSVKRITDESVLVSNKNWGSSGMDAVHGDYDGDGISDLAVYERATGNWYIRTIKDGQAPIVYSLNWGNKNMDPVPGDYDGDGKFDLAVYERTTGKWYIRHLDNSPPIAFGYAWGFRTLAPVAGDYDGDGKWDLSVYDRNSGKWYIHSLAKNTNIAYGMSWGNKSMDPAPGDYDGDGKWDLAVYERTTGKWFIRNLSDGPAIAYAKSFGSSSMKPVAGDYNGDGQSDLAVYDKNYGQWFIQDLKTGQTIVYGEKWGSSHTLPVSATK